MCLHAPRLRVVLRTASVMAARIMSWNRRLTEHFAMARA
jgi:hypothetical protein